MKKLLIFSLLASFAFFSSCGKDDDSGEDTTLDYEITINNPTTDDKRVNETLPIEVVFKSGSEGTIHHINIRIYNKETNVEAYNGPDDAHVMEASGTYTFSHNLLLNHSNNVMGHTDWIMEAKVWGHEAGSEEVTKTLEFHVHPDNTITINNPTTDDKKVNDIVPIEIVFATVSGATVHHVNLRVYNKADASIEAYNGPGDAHVMETSGTYTLSHDLELSAANNVEAHTDWIVEAKMWGHEPGSEEVTKTLEFHVHPE